MLNTRRIVLGVSGGVAAYKAAYLCRRLLEEGADVRVVMTTSAERFVGSQTFAALTGHHPVKHLFDAASVSPHTDLGRWAELMVIAPATLHTLSKVANGISGDAVATTALATAAPLLLAPAMHTEMWEHPSTQRIVESLRSDGHLLVGPDEGELAGGDVGIGRMVEPEEIVAACIRILAGSNGSPWTGRRLVITAGGTREPIDPVRFVGNRSSGKMGYAIAAAAARQGAEVTLVSSSHLEPPYGVAVVAVETAEEMAAATWNLAAGADVAVLAAAVADFRPVAPASGKLRRIDGVPELRLEPTPNILEGIAKMENRPFLVGFAAQTGSLDDAARKATTYGVDLLVANDVAAPGSGFATDTNQVTIFTPDGLGDPWPLMTKKEVAERLLALVAGRLPG